MPLSAQELAAVEHALDGASLWGAELETQYRVLACTFEPRPERHPFPAVDDPRLQVLFHPVHTILGTLRERDPQGRTAILRFAVTQLLDVVASFDGATVRAPVFGQGEPAPGEWGPAEAGWSLEGRARTFDGRSHDLRVGLRGADDRALDLYASFDDIRLRTPDGRELDAAELPGAAPA